MTFQEISGGRDSRSDQEGARYVRDDGGFAVECLGFFTEAELEAKLAQLRDANRFYGVRSFIGQERR